MSLIKCSECGKEVSTNAAACPHCGNPIASQTAMSQSESHSEETAKELKRKAFEIDEDKLIKPKTLSQFPPSKAYLAKVVIATLFVSFLAIYFFGGNNGSSHRGSSSSTPAAHVPAVKALLRIETELDSGIAYSTYISLLNDAKYKANDISDPGYALTFRTYDQAIRAYEIAGALWEMELTRGKTISFDEFTHYPDLSLALGIAPKSNKYVNANFVDIEGVKRELLKEAARQVHFYSDM